MCQTNAKGAAGRWRTDSWGSPLYLAPRETYPAAAPYEFRNSRRRPGSNRLMNKLDIPGTYQRFVGKIGERHGDAPDRAMAEAVGGEFEAVGALERDLLIQYGLGPDDYLVDVGCGSGRLASALADYL